MNNVITFPVGSAALGRRSATVSGCEQDVFAPEQAASLTFEDGRLYGWASREGRLPAHYWRLEADLKALVAQHGVVMAARFLALPVLFVRGWVVEIGLDAARGLRLAPTTEAATVQRETEFPAMPRSPLADDAFLWTSLPAYA